MKRPPAPLAVPGALVLLATLTLLAACTPPAALTDAPLVTGFRVSPTFNAFTGPCDIRYTLAEPAFVQVRVTQRQPDGTVALVRQVTTEGRETPGARTAAWRGTGANGLFAPQGEYTVELFVRMDGQDRAEEWTLPTVMFRS